MRRVTPENEEAARAAGRAAADRGAVCVPAHCSTYLSLIEGFKIGEGAAHLAQRWIEGHRGRIAELNPISL